MVVLNHLKRDCTMERHAPDPLCAVEEVRGEESRREIERICGVVSLRPCSCLFTRWSLSVCPPFLPVWAAVPATRGLLEADPSPRAPSGETKDDSPAHTS